MKRATRPDALAFLASALDAGTAEDRRDLVRDALVEVLPAFTGAYPYGDPGYVIADRADAGLEVEYYDRAGENDGDWTLTVDAAAAAVWAVCSGADVDDALCLAARGDIKAPALAEVIGALARFVTGKAAA